MIYIWNKFEIKLGSPFVCCSGSESKKVSDSEYLNGG